MMIPKLLAQHPKNHAPFVDATGLHAGALLGDVRHDPYQSGGVETPPHHLVEAGAIHRAHTGVCILMKSPCSASRLRIISHSHARAKFCHHRQEPRVQWHDGTHGSCAL